MSKLYRRLSTSGNSMAPLPPSHAWTTKHPHNCSSSSNPRPYSLLPPPSPPLPPPSSSLPRYSFCCRACNVLGSISNESLESTYSWHPDTSISTYHGLTGLPSVLILREPPRLQLLFMTSLMLGERGFQTGSHSMPRYSTFDNPSNGSFKRTQLQAYLKFPPSSRILRISF